MPVLYGVFLFMGVAALKGMQVYIYNKCNTVYLMHFKHTFPQHFFTTFCVEIFFLYSEKMTIASVVLFQFVDRLALIFMPKKYQPDHMYLRHVPIKRVHLFTLFQIVCLAILWVVKMIKSISILFPVMVTFSLDISDYEIYSWVWINIH